MPNDWDHLERDTAPKKKGCSYCKYTGAIPTVFAPEGVSDFIPCPKCQKCKLCNGYPRGCGNPDCPYTLEETGGPTW